MMCPPSHAQTRRGKRKGGEARAHLSPRACQLGLVAAPLQWRWGRAGHGGSFRQVRCLQWGGTSALHLPSLPGHVSIPASSIYQPKDSSFPFISQLLLPPLSYMITEPKPWKGPQAEEASAIWAVIPEAPFQGTTQNLIVPSLCSLPWILLEHKTTELIRRQKMCELQGESHVLLIFIASVTWQHRAKSADKTIYTYNIHTHNILQVIT